MSISVVKIDDKLHRNSGSSRILQKKSVIFEWLFKESLIFHTRAQPYKRRWLEEFLTAQFYCYEVLCTIRFISLFVHKKFQDEDVGSVRFQRRTEAFSDPDARRSCWGFQVQRPRTIHVRDVPFEGRDPKNEILLGLLFKFPLRS